MNLKQLLRVAGVSNNIAAEVEKKANKTTAEKELEHQERALAMTKMMVNEALRGRKAQGDAQPPFPRKSIIIDEK